MILIPSPSVLLNSFIKFIQTRYSKYYKYYINWTRRTWNYIDNGRCYHIRLQLYMPPDIHNTPSI